MAGQTITFSQLSEEQKKDLIILLTTPPALERDWQTTTLEVKDEQSQQSQTFTFSKQEAEKWLESQLKNRLPQKLALETENYSQNHQSRQRVQDYFLGKENKASQLGQDFLAKLGQQAWRLGGEQPQNLLSQAQLKKATTAKREIHLLLENRVTTALINNLENYREPYKSQILQAISAEASSRLLPFFQQAVEISPEDIKNLTRELYKDVLIGAAIADKNGFENDLEKVFLMPKEEKETIKQAKTTLDRFDHGLKPQPIIGFVSTSQEAQDIAKNLSEKWGEEIRPETVEAHIQNLDPTKIDQNWGDPVLSNNLRKFNEAMAETPEEGSLRKRLPFSYHFISPEEKAQRLRQKTIKRQNWEKQMDITWKGIIRTPRRRLRKAFAQSQRWQSFKSTAVKVTPGYWIGKAKNKISQSTLGKAWKSWGNKVENFKQKSRFGVLLAPRMRIGRAVGNWLAKKGMEKAGQALIQKGAKGLAKHVLVAALTKIGLGSVAGPIGTAITTGWELFKFIKEKKSREKIFKWARNLAAAAAYTIYKLFTLSPFATGGAMLGFAYFGPPGALIGGAGGFLIDKTVQAVGGISKSFSGLLGKAATGLETIGSLPSAVSSLPLSFPSVAVPVIGSIGAVAFAGFFALSTLFSAFADLSATEQKTDTTMSGGGSGFDSGEEASRSAQARASSVKMAEDIIDALLDCDNLEKESISRYDYALVNINTWETAKACLVEEGFSEDDLFYLNPNNCPYIEKGASYPSYNKLQCVCFAVAVTNEKLEKKNSASDYATDDLDTAWESLTEGDLIVAGEDHCYGGHIALVLERDGDSIYIAEANGDKGGVGKRKIGLSVIKENYRGFISNY